MPPFVGDDRHQLVAELLVAYDEVDAHRAPRWVSLEAHTGWGKTRVLHEFYRRLAAERQSTPGYWPAAIESAAGPASGDSRRKAIYPELMSPPREALPEWLWWGLTCQSNGYVRTQAIADDLTQITAHERALTLRWKKDAGLRRRFASSLRRRRTELAGSVAGEAVSVAAGLANVAFPGLGVVLELSKWAVEGTREHWQAGREVGELDVTGGSRGDIVEELAPGLGQMARVVPVVVAVEDFHEADDSLVALLARLLSAEGSAILLLTTAWPGLLDEDRRPAHRLTTTGVPVRRLRERGECGADRLAALELAARSELVRTLLPAASDDVVEALAGRYRTPLALEVVMALPETWEAIDDGTPPQGWVDELPLDLYDLYRRAWAAVPERLRDRLMLAALAARPGSASVEEIWEGPLLDQTASEFLAVANEHTRDPKAAAADAPETAYAWVDAIDDVLRTFHEPIQLDIVSTAARKRFHRRTVRFYQTLANGIEVRVERDHASRRFANARARPTRTETSPLVGEAGWGPGRRPPTMIRDPWAVRDRASRHRAELIVALGAEGFIEKSSIWVEASMALCSYLAGQRDLSALRRAIAVGEATIAHLDDLKSIQSWGLRRHLARAYYEAGQVDEAIVLFEQILVRREGNFGAYSAYSPAVLRSRGVLAGAYVEVGRVDEAIILFEQVLADAERATNPGHPLALISRSDLAGAYVEVGRIDEAIRLYERTIAHLERALAPDHPSVVTSWNNLAGAYVEVGRIDEAIQLYERTIVERERVFGVDVGPTTRTSRSKLASNLTFPDTITSRHSLASAYRATGRTEEAIAMFERTLADRERVLGANDPDTLDSRNNLAEAYKEAGRVDEAIAMFERSVADRERVLGAEARR